MSAKKTRKKHLHHTAASAANPYERKPWISMTSGIKLIALASLLMGGLTIWQLQPAAGWGMALLYGFIYAAMIWIIFLGMQLFYRWLHPVKRDSSQGEQQ